MAVKTRGKIIYHFGYIQKRVDDILIRLQKVDELARGQHPAVYEAMTPLILILEELCQAIDKLRLEL